MPLAEWDTHMTPGECFRLCEGLLAEPGSHLFASVAGWPMPASLDVLLAADVFDAVIASGGGKDRHPRPWTKTNAHAPDGASHYRSTLDPQKARHALDRLAPGKDESACQRLPMPTSP